MATLHLCNSWSVTWNGYTRSFRGWFNYEWYPNHSATQARLRIVNYGIEKIPTGKTTWEQSYGDFTFSGAYSRSYTRNCSSSVITFAATANSRIQMEGTLNADVYFNKTTAAQSKTVTLTASKRSSVWAGSASGTLSMTVPALAAYTISYNANSGSGAPGSQTKYYGQPITVPTTVPTRENYTFLGWLWNNSGDLIQPGASWNGANEAGTFYASWKINYIAPTISGLKAYRTESSTSSTFSPAGTYVYISFSYTGGTNDGGNSYISPTCVISINNTEKLNTTLSASGTQTYRYGTYALDTKATVSVTLSDATGNIPVTDVVTVPTAQFPIALLANGTAMGLMHYAVAGQLLTLTDGTVIDGDLLFLIDDNTTSGLDGQINMAIASLGWDDGENNVIVE